MADPNENLDINAMLDAMDKLAASGAQLSDAFVSMRKKLVEEQKSVSQINQDFTETHKLLENHKKGIDKSYKALSEHLTLGQQQEKLNKEQLKDAKEWTVSLKQHLKYLDRNMAGLDKSSDEYKTLNAMQEQANKDLMLVSEARRKSISPIQRGTLAWEKFSNTHVDWIGRTLAETLKGVSTSLGKFGHSLLAGGTKMDALGGTAQLMNNITKSFGDAVKNIPIVGGVLNVAFKAASQAMDVLGRETQKVYKNFETIAHSGGLFAHGMGQMITVAHNAGLNLDQFGEVIKNNSRYFSMIGGTVAEGASRFASVSGELDKNGGKLRDRLLKLGYDYQDQADNLADFMGQLQATGNLRNRNDKEVAASAVDYMTTLKTLTSLTGEQAKAARERVREASTQAAVQARLGEMGEEGQKKFGAAITFFGGIDKNLGKALQQMLVNNGHVIDKQLNIVLSRVPALRDLMQQTIKDAQNQGLTLQQEQKLLIERFHSISKTMHGNSAEASRTIGRVSLFGKGLDEVSGILSHLFSYSLVGAKKGFEHAGDAAKEAGDTTDPLTTAMVGVQHKFQAMGVQMETLVQKKSGLLSIYAETQDKLLGATAKLVQGFSGLGDILGTLTGTNKKSTWQQIKESLGFGGESTTTGGGTSMADNFFSGAAMGGYTGSAINIPGFSNGPEAKGPVVSGVIRRATPAVPTPSTAQVTPTTAPAATVEQSQIDRSASIDSSLKGIHKQSERQTLIMQKLLDGQH